MRRYKLGFTVATTQPQGKLSSRLTIYAPNDNEALKQLKRTLYEKGLIQRGKDLLKVWFE